MGSAVLRTEASMESSMMDLQGPELLRPGNISNDRSPKRRRLNDQSFQEPPPYPRQIPQIDDQKDYAICINQQEAEIHRRCNIRALLNDVKAPALVETGEDECCYGMVR